MDGIFIVNAGLVLLAPFLPLFFARLDLLRSDASGRSAWRSPESRDRAIHLLQWLVDERCDAPEPSLALNKLLCGKAIAEPLIARIEPSEAECAIGRSLLHAAVGRWPLMKGSSIAALRETFLQREGRISFADEGPVVDVERKTLDVLIDSGPGGHSMILHPWMTQPIRVHW